MPPELENAVAAQLTPDGWIGLVRQSAKDEAITKPLTLVWSSGDAKVERLEMPFASTSDPTGTVPRLVASDLALRRFLVAVGGSPNVKVHVWEAGKRSAEVEGTFPDYGGHAIAKTQAIVITGRMDRRGFVDHANGRQAKRYRNGAWTSFDLPKPAEKDWASCFWDATARPDSDEIVLLQICAAPRREMAYALYRLDADGDGATRIPFDNGVFNPVRAARGSFKIEADGTIDLGSTISGVEEGEMTLARLRGGHDPWSIVHVRMPSRLLSSAGMDGDHVLLTDGEKDLRESSDGGKTFQPERALARGALGYFRGCNPTGCAFLTLGSERVPARAIFRRW